MMILQKYFLERWWIKYFAYWNMVNIFEEIFVKIDCKILKLFLYIS